jgi:hypothetical protein
MKKPYRQADGYYHVDGKKYKTLFGSREQVMNGTVHKTTGGLTKENLVMNKWGRIVSANKYKTAKKEMRLQKYGFFAKKGKFGAVSRKMKRGGADANVPTNPNPEGVNPTNTDDNALNPQLNPVVVPPPVVNPVVVELPPTNTNATTNTNAPPASTNTNAAPTTGAPDTTTTLPPTTTNSTATGQPGGKSKKQNKSKKRR